MAKVSKRVEHDWVMVTARFNNGVEAKVKWNRAGCDAAITPRDPAAAKTLSLIAAQAQKLPGMTIGKIADVMAQVAGASEVLGDYVDGLKKELGVSGEQQKLAAGPASTQVTIKKSRGWEIAGVFPSGERFELKINKSSVGLRTNPPIGSRDDDLIRVVFAMKNAGVLDDAEMAERIKEAAEGSDDMDAWVESVRGLLAPAPRR